MKTTSYTDEHIKFIREQRAAGLEWKEVAEEFLDKFGIKKTGNALRKANSTFEDYDLSQDEMIKNVKAAYSARKAKSKTNKELKAVLEQQVTQDEFLAEFKCILKENPIKVHKPVKQKKTKKKKASKRTIVAHLSDTHFGSDIDGEEMGGLNHYGSIEEARRLAFFTREIANYKIEHREDTDLILACNGDLLQGVIHGIDTCVPLASQFSRALSLLTQQISYLANHFKNVKVIFTLDNHGRAQHRPDKGRPTKNKWDGYATMLHVAVEHALRDFKNVEIDIPVTPYWYGEIMGHNYLILHSDAVLSTGSIGKNVSVEVIKNKINDLSKGIGPIDVVLCGHTHVPLTTILNNGVRLVCNGNLSGVDEYCLTLGIVTNHPSQQLFEVTDNYPVGDLRNVMVLQADTMEELDEIIKPFEGKF